MPRFFADSVSEITEIKGQDAIHIQRALRMRVGDNLTLCDQKGSDYFCEITGFDSDCVTVKVLYRTPTECEPLTAVTLYQGLPKKDKMELIIQKTVELGVSSIVPVQTARSVTQIESGEKAEKRRLRWQKIADEAAGQSGRGILPQVTEPISFKQALERIVSLNEPVIVFYEGGERPICGLVDRTVRRLSIFVGPEGGFEPSEIEALTAINARTATLGPRILRCETAPIAALAVIMALTGNME